MSGQSFFPDEENARKSSDEILPVVYRELRALAQSRLAKESPGNTLTPTALVHEVYLRLNRSGEEPQWDSNAHFFGAAAQAMRRILIENARRKIARRRGQRNQSFDGEFPELNFEMSEDRAILLLDLDECLNRFSVDYPKESRLVQLRFFAGLTMKEAGECLGITERTAQRYWAFSRAMLHKLMNGGEFPTDQQG